MTDWNNPQRAASSESQYSLMEFMRGTRARMAEMMDLLSDADATPQQRLKGSLALIAIHVATFALRDTDLTDEQRRDVALDVALELLD